MKSSTIRFSTFPRTEPPPTFVEDLVSVFRKHEDEIATEINDKGLRSDDVLSILGTDLLDLGFQVEASKKRADKLERPVFFGENGIPTLRYEIDAYHPEWKCGLEVEAGRGWMGNAVYRDLVQAAVMVGVEYLCLAVSNVYRYKSSGKPAKSRDYINARQLAEAIYGHSRLRLPYNLILIGY
jgi:hypothetical protein